MKEQHFHQDASPSSDSWTPRMRAAHPRLVGDLIEVHEHFSADDLERVRTLARQRPELFTRGCYRTDQPDGAGCLLWHLSGGRIASKEELTRAFTGKTGHEARQLPEYQAVKYVVRVWDRMMPGNDRYDGTNDLSLELFVDTLEHVIARRVRFRTADSV